MSIGDDGGYGDGRGTGTGQTRTRLPDGESDTYGAPRRARSGLSSRNLITVVGVVVLLIAAIAFANRGGSGNDETGSGSGSGGSTKDQAAAQPTAPTGTKPVTGKTGGIASGFPQTEQGAQSAAANYVVALGSSTMFNRDQRHQIVSTVMAPSAVAALQSKLDSAYSPAFFKNAGLKPDGTAPAGMTFVNRTIPVGTKATAFSPTEATVEVWSTGLLGLAGEGSTKPVTTDWLTFTMKLTWTGTDWKTLSYAQKNGPAPVSGDVPASGAKEIAGAVAGYGGFTYAR
ncbi:hypothetical protein [Streptomyces sp. 769]|uniref:hypothetical protein n=1 Tax=Streptomyces sp. 769 TaxID=1262452 RepID=UPI00057CA7F4|nr:hypothetical protein [Streptomyces sp. 769]AJC56775.1 putative integral membrane protein [Streptomyces sp. 769]